jgi:hypothetical protein
MYWAGSIKRHHDSHFHSRTVSRNIRLLRTASCQNVEWFCFPNSAIDMCRAWLTAAVFEFSTARQRRNNNDPTMTGPLMQATAIPRFLLPQLSWSVRACRPVALGVLEARRHKCSSSSKRRTALPVSSIVPTQTIRQWRQRSSQYANGYDSALAFQRNFSATAPQSKDHHFDTLKFVQRLKEEGFTEEQAEGMMRVLSDVIEERYMQLLHAPRQFAN